MAKASKQPRAVRKTGVKTPGSARKTGKRANAQSLSKRLPAGKKPAAAMTRGRGKKDPIPSSQVALASQTLPMKIEPGPVEQALKKLRMELAHWAKKGRFTKVRFRLRGKPLAPDIPIGALLAAEAATFWWAGLLQAALVNLGAKALLDVELVSEADSVVARGKAALLSGDLQRALELFAAALELDRDCAAAYLNLGIASKLKGDFAAARSNLEHAVRLDPSGTWGEEARRLLELLAKTRVATGSP